ncbi:MAG: FAD-NAD(P)-binding, partial [Miltoncostaeaceae bacterium]|nr:FAD-NAD(P)-binding [Miltoncostaeaceae bacterium]
MAAPGRSARGRVAVVGGGAAGALAAVHLLAAGAPDVVVVDPAPHVGPGVAYGPTARDTLLNVPAGRL